MVSKLREDVWWESDKRCSYCTVELTIETATMDHVRPKADGGRRRKSNIVIACVPCNTRKGKLSVEEFLRSEFLRARLAAVQSGDPVRVPRIGERFRERRVKKPKASDG